MTSAEDGFLIGYSSLFSAAPGDEISFHVSTDADYYDVDFVHLTRRHARFDLATVTPCASLAQFGQTLPGNVRRTFPGSCVEIFNPEKDYAPLKSWTVGLWIWCGQTQGTEQILLAANSVDGSTGWELLLDEKNRPVCRTFLSSRVEPLVASEEILTPRSWYALMVSYNAQNQLGKLAFQRRGSARIVRTSGHSDRHQPLPIDYLTIAAKRANGPYGRRVPSAAFSGKLEDVTIRRSDLCADPGAVVTDRSAHNLVAWWDFSDGISSNHVRDRGPLNLHGVTVNAPTRAVTGHNWSGRHVDWRQAPHEYGAIYFHHDDLADAAWPADFRIRIPKGIRSGVYGARCTSTSGIDCIPFIVTPTTPTSRIAVVLPTYTYQAYANSRVALERDFLSSGAVGRSVVRGKDLDLLRENTEWGRSLYDCHPDGSGTVLSSRLRPITNFRPDYNHWVSGGPRNFSADLCLLAWLEDQGRVADIITDQELNEGSSDLLRSYSVVLTGSHPEYATESMLDALVDYYETGGRLMYLGGNGFYWVTTVHGCRAELIEVRRGNAGTRPWTSEPGESHHASTGEPGGLWRHRGRPPNFLVGVGFVAQGWDECAGYYRMSPAARDPRYSWIFKDVKDDEAIGNFGLIMNGAAGDEIDRYDPLLGPDDVVILANSEGHSESYCMAVEELEQSTPSVTASSDPRVRSTLICRENQNGGAVFSVGSMAWVGSLVSDNGNNNVSWITRNILDRFLK